MSDLITPKYAVGDTVYVPDLVRDSEALPCPDCLGTKKWTVTTPGGTTAECDCLRCSTRYTVAELPSLTRVIYKPVAKPVLIGKIETSTHPWSHDDKVKYSQGPNGGYVYNETAVHSTPEAALAVATVRAAEAQAQEDKKPEAIEAAKLARLPFRFAEFARTSKSRWDAWYRYRGLVADVESVIEDESLDASELRDGIAEQLNFAANYRETPEIGKAIAAIREHATPEIEAPLAILECTLSIASAQHEGHGETGESANG